MLIITNNVLLKWTQTVTCKQILIPNDGLTLCWGSVAQFQQLHTNWQHLEHTTVQAAIAFTEMDWMIYLSSI